MERKASRVPRESQSAASPNASMEGGRPLPAAHRVPAWARAMGDRPPLNVFAPGRPLVGKGGDAHEREAEQVAAGGHRAAAPRETRPSAAPHPATPPFIQQALDSPGQPLDKGTRARMEARLGLDLGAVRVHADARAAASARSLAANAYTVGHHIVFGSGRFAPGTSAGDKLLAHELTHVAQQQSGRGDVPAIQREGADPLSGGAVSLHPRPTPSLNLFDPALMAQVVRESMAAQEAPVRQWLTTHVDSLRLLSLEAVVQQVRQAVPEAARLPDVQLQGVVREWAQANNIALPRLSILSQAGTQGVPPAPAGASIADSDLVKTVKSAVSVVTEGVGIERQHGRLNISVRGTMVELRKGSFRAGGIIGWSGSLGIETQYKDAHLSGELSKDGWLLRLSLPLDAPLSNLANLATVFQEGESALRGVAAATARFQKLEDASAVADAIKPHVEPLKEAVKAFQGVAAASKLGERQVAVGVTASGPLQTKEAKGDQATPGVTIQATMTVRF